MLRNSFGKKERCIIQLENILTLQNITKRYPGVTALDKVSVSFKQGEIHAIMGENGAGKSTLIKIISGAITPDEGKICFDNKEYAHMTPALSLAEGVGVIYQEFNLVPNMSVVENVFLGAKVGGRIMPDFRKMRQISAEIFEQLGVSIDLDSQVGMLSIAHQQMVEIAKAVCRNVKILIMDEPSSAIANTEVENMLKVVARLKESGVTILYISHRMDEVFRIADRVTVLRDGQYISTKTLGKENCAELRKTIITLMVGREISENYPHRLIKPGKAVLEVKELCGNGTHDISFTLNKGEILGIAGLVGAGRTELAKVLYGAAKADKGEILINGKSVKINNPRQSISLGIGLIPENRKTEGAFLEYSILWNISSMCLKRLSSATVISRKREAALSKHYIQRMRIKTPSATQLVKNLSGGNQQKVVLAKVLAAQTDILIFDEPTRGIDVGAKTEIYLLMNELTEQGISIIMISSEMEELIGMCDRILVMRKGWMVGEVQNDRFDQKLILELASGF